MNIYEEALKFHEDLKGKLEICSRVKIENEKDSGLRTVIINIIQ